MTRVITIAHQPSDNTRLLAKACAKGFEKAQALTEVSIEFDVKRPQQVDADAVRSCDGIMIISTENFGYMAGLIKDFFERIYYPLLEVKRGLPTAVCVRAGLDGTGTIRSVENILAGLNWRLIQPPLLLKGAWQASFTEQTSELAATLALGCAENIY